jgi:hypothetical protein
MPDRHRRRGRSPRCSWRRRNEGDHPASALAAGVPAGAEAGGGGPVRAGEPLGHARLAVGRHGLGTGRGLRLSADPAVVHPGRSSGPTADRLAPARGFGREGARSSRSGIAVALVGTPIARTRRRACGVRGRAIGRWSVCGHGVMGIRPVEATALEIGPRIWLVGASTIQGRVGPTSAGVWSHVAARAGVGRSSAGVHRLVSGCAVGRSICAARTCASSAANDRQDDDDQRVRAHGPPFRR